MRVCVSFTAAVQQKLLLLDSALVAATLINVIQKLTVLDLEYSNIGQHAASDLAKGLCCNNILEQLWLKSNILCDDMELC